MTTRALLSEFDLEMQATRSVLERVPMDRRDWRPHDRSMSLGDLAVHLARLPIWAAMTLEGDGFDLDSPEAEELTAPEIEDGDALLDFFDGCRSQAREAIASAPEEAFGESWELRKGDETVFSAPKSMVLRRFVISHHIHHRGQLTVYLRLLDVAVPQTFGPTADEPDFT